MQHDDPTVLPDKVPRTLPAELLKLTYQNRLRAIGRELDLSNSRSVLVLEVDGGFVVRAVSRDDRDIDLVEFTDETYPERMISATEARGEGERDESPSPVAPTGFEDLFRALGRVLDERNAANIVIVEKLKSILVTGDILTGDSRAPFDSELDKERITTLLDRSFRMRRNGD
jgi:hypothetical protein